MGVERTHIFDPGTASREPYQDPIRLSLRRRLMRPLAEVRAQLGVVPVEQSHPAGILTGGAESRWSFASAIC